jgi:ATP-dependent Clp protease protease subunit
MTYSSDYLTAALDKGVDIPGRRLFLHGDVDEGSIAMLIRGMYLLEAHSSREPISLFVSSYGGSLDDAFALHDVTRTISCPVHTVALGKCQSAAPMLVACGQTGHRFATANTTFMLHDVRLSNIDGRPSEIDAWAQDAKAGMVRYAALLSKYTKKRAAHWARLFSAKADLFFGVDEALEWGLVDHIWSQKDDEV